MDALACESGSGATINTIKRQLAEIEIDLGLTPRAWALGFDAFRFFVDIGQWEEAVLACETLFRCDQPQSLAALGHGLWLSITFPIDPAITVSQLRYVVEETTEDADGAAVAAAVATYVVELRGDSKGGDDATLVAGQMINQVARQHGNVRTPEEFERWVKRLELDAPAKILVRMRNIIDVLVQDDWWIDRAALQATIPQD